MKLWYAADDPPFIAADCVAGGGTGCMAGGGTDCVSCGGTDCVAGGGAAVCGAVCDCWDNDFTIIK